jgi:hypothetical protein
MDILSFFNMNYCEVRKEIIGIFDPDEVKDEVYALFTVDDDEDDTNAGDVDIDPFFYNSDYYVKGDYTVNDDIVDKVIKLIKEKGIDLGEDEHTLN